MIGPSLPLPDASQGRAKPSPEARLGAHDLHPHGPPSDNRTLKDRLVREGHPHLALVLDDAPAVAYWRNDRTTWRRIERLDNWLGHSWTLYCAFTPVELSGQTPAELLLRRHL